MYKLVFISTLSFLLFACNNDKNAKLESEKWETVMKKHDVVMPLMSPINKVKKELMALDNLIAKDSLKVVQLINDLDKADEGMMDWMNGFQQLGKLQKEKTHEEIMEYLENQDQLIQKVGDQMTNSIKEGRDFLRKIDN